MQDDVSRTTAMPPSKSWTGRLDVELWKWCQANPSEAAFAIQRMRHALEQAQDCIRGETPEDGMTPEDAREDTIIRIREALGL